MNMKPISSQISVFLSDGVMNPSRFIDDINKHFDNIFIKEDYVLNLEDAPNDMPLVRCRSNDGRFIYDFAKKRINFYLNFNDFDGLSLFEDYKYKVKNMLKNVVMNYSDISRVGLAINYYIEGKDKNCSYWANKYNFPFFNSESTSEITYTINNNFIYKGLKFNKILILTTGKITNTMNAPIISIDINNVSTAKINEQTFHYIFDELDFYKKESLEKIFSSE